MKEDNPREELEVQRQTIPGYTVKTGEAQCGEIEAAGRKLVENRGTTRVTV